MEPVISENTNPKFNFMETIFLKVSSLVMPWIILGAIPRFQFGYWGQIEGQIVITHMICSLLAINILVILFRHKKLRFILWEPVIVIPFILGLFSIFSAFFQRIPNLALYGSPQLGQGAFWYFDLSIMTLLYFMVWSNKNWRIPLLVSIFSVILFVTLFSLRPDLGQYQLWFFFFYDYLCFYGLAFIIIISSFINLHTKNNLFKIVNQRYFIIFLYISLGPYFWILKNESGCLVWLLVGLFWLAVEILKKGAILKDIRKIIHINLYSPKFFTFIILLASFCVLLSSFIFWDGTSSMDASFKQDTSNPLFHLSHIATLVARGSIIRVLLEHLDSVKVFFVGYGWGNISELLISSFTEETFTQINTGNRVHFHTHNELFEHIFSVGIMGFVFYVLYAFHLIKNAFTRGSIFPYLWLLYFLLCCFWFQFISSLPLLALATATLITHPNSSSDRYIKKLKHFGDNLYFSMSYLILILGFLVFASVMGLITTNNTQEFSPNRLIQLSKSVETQSCSFPIRDFDRGGVHLSQMLDGYTTYIRNQIESDEPLVETDYDVMKWYLCAVDEVITTNKASIELVNADINTVSYFSSIESSDLRGNLMNLRNNYLDIWDERIRLLLTLAPKRSDQITPYVSTLLIRGKFDEIRKICSFARQFERDVPYCDLAEAAIYIGNNELDKAAFLIERADQSGALDVEDKCLHREEDQTCLHWQKGINPELIKVLREFVKTYRETNN